MGALSSAVVVVAVASLSAASAWAEPVCKPVTGQFEAVLVAPSNCPSPVGLCTSGRVWGGLQGDYFFVMRSLVSTGDPTVPTVVFFTGKSDILINGGTIQGTDTGTIDLPPGAGGFASLITFTGGTGTGAGATGQIRLRGHLDAMAGTTTGDYAGTLCRP